LKAMLNNYQARMLRVVDHIDRYPEENLNLDTLSSIAAFSKYHFHRQFSATFGLSVHRYVQLARMKRASHQLVSGEAQSGHCGLRLLGLSKMLEARSCRSPLNKTT